MSSTDFEFPASPDDLLYPAIFYEDKAYFLERSNKFLASYFGGPPGLPITGIPYGPRGLHHILTVSGECFEPLRRIPGSDRLYLIYGMCFDGCKLAYKSTIFKGDKSLMYQGIEILEMTPVNSSSDWPYQSFPDLLPYFALRLQTCVDCTLEEFSQVSSQPLEADPNEAIVIVPPSPMFGVSLWGPAGDAEGVQIVFRCAMERHGIVRVDTQCG